MAYPWQKAIQDLLDCDSRLVRQWISVNRRSKVAVQPTRDFSNDAAPVELIVEPPSREELQPVLIVACLSITAQKGGSHDGTIDEHQGDSPGTRESSRADDVPEPSLSRERTWHAMVTTAQQFPPRRTWEFQKPNRTVRHVLGQ